MALPRNGFRLLAGDSGMTDLVRSTTLRARVLGIGEGFLTEPWWCRTLVLAAERTARRGGTVRLVELNGQPGVLGFDADGTLIAAWALQISDGAIQAIHGVTNPDKLVHISSTILPSLPPA